MQPHKASSPKLSSSAPPFQRNPKASIEEKVAIGISSRGSRENTVKQLSVCKHSFVTIIGAFLPRPAATLALCFISKSDFYASGGSCVA